MNDNITYQSMKPRYRVYWPDLGTHSDRTFRTQNDAEEYGALMGMLFEVVPA
jgi:hypothetical protein